MEAFDPTGRVRAGWYECPLVSCDDRQMPRQAPIWLIGSASVFGLVGGVQIVRSTVEVMFGVYDQMSNPGPVVAVPVFAWEVTLAVWLTVKGVRPVSFLTAHAGSPAVTASAR